MTNKAVYTIVVDAQQHTTITIKHIKYQTVAKQLESGINRIEFESYINWDSNGFKISSSHPVTINDITFKIISVDMIENRIFLLKQEINKVDIFPERSNLIQNNQHLSNKGILFMTNFKPMVINEHDIAIVRFMTKRIVLS